MTSVQKRTNQIQKFFGSEYIVEATHADGYAYKAVVYRRSDPLANRSAHYQVKFFHQRKGQRFWGYRIMRFIAAGAQSNSYINDRRGITRIESLRPYLVASLLVES